MRKIFASIGVVLFVFASQAYDPKKLEGRWQIEDETGHIAEIWIGNDGAFTRELPKKPGVKIRGDMEAGGGGRIKINVYADEYARPGFKICQAEVILVPDGPDGNNTFRTRQLDPPKRTPACSWNIRKSIRLPSVGVR